MNDVFYPSSYGVKTSKSFPRVKFPATFTLSANEKHDSNEQESLKQLDEVVIQYVEMEREKIGATKLH